MTETDARISHRRRISPVWVVPIVAVLLGAWMVFYTWKNEGPEIEIRFKTAEGIEAGKTKIKARSVEIGLVEQVELSDDFEHVIVTAKLERFAKPLLREDSKFWVVTARVGAGGVSGLGTILSGGYIELAPGDGLEGRRKFIGLDEAPVTPAGTPGILFTLFSKKTGSINPGNPILYKGFKVGRIESRTFDVKDQLMRYTAFVEAPYDVLVTENTRFWDSSGISLNATANGIELQTTSLEALLIGGVAFGLPDGVEPGAKAASGTDFELYPNYQSINEKPYRYAIEYVVLFDRSVRGLSPGAPVEYRGLRAGEVVRILLKEMIEHRETEVRRADRRGKIAVLIRLEPGPLQMGDTPEGVTLLQSVLKSGVAEGMRATLETGNLLTGSLLVALDYHENVKPAHLETFAGWPTIPTADSGLQNIEAKVAAVLDKLNALPLDKVVNTANTTLESANATILDLHNSIDELNAILANEDLQTLPQSVQDTLDELDRTLKKFSGLAGTLEKQPNSLLFPRQIETDPEPPAGAPSP